MPKPLDVEDLDAQDLTELLTELKGSPVKVKNPAKGRTDLLAVLAEQNKSIVVNDDGNFEILDQPAPKAKGKAKAAPVEDDEEDEAPPPKAKAKAKAAPVEDDEDEDEDEDEEEAAPPPKAKAKPAPAPKAKAKAAPVEDDEDEDEEEVPPPKAKAKPAPAPKAKAKPAPVEDDEDEDEDEDEEEVKPKAKRGSGLIPKEPKIKDGKITILEKDRAFKAESIRAVLWGVMRKNKTVASYFTAAEATDAASTARGFLNVAVKEGWISVE